MSWRLLKDYYLFMIIHTSVHHLQMFPIDCGVKQPPRTQWECFVLRSEVQSNTNKFVWEEFWPLPEPAFPPSAVCLLSRSGKRKTTRHTGVTPAALPRSDSPFTRCLSLKQWSHPLTRNPLIVLNTFHSCGLKSHFPIQKKMAEGERKWPWQEVLACLRHSSFRLLADIVLNYCCPIQQFNTT